MITVSFNLTKDDVLALACYYHSTSATVTKGRLTLQVASCALLAGIGLVMVCQSDELPYVGAGLLVCAGLAIVFVPRWHRSALRRTAEKMFAESSYQEAFGGYTLALSDAGIASTSPIGEAKYTWRAVDRVSLTPEHLFIFLVGASGFAIPRSQVPDATIQEMKAFVESHVRGTEPTAAPTERPAQPSSGQGPAEGPPAAG